MVHLMWDYMTHDNTIYKYRPLTVMFMFHRKTNHDCMSHTVLYVIPESNKRKLFTQTQNRIETQ